MNASYNTPWFIVPYLPKFDKFKEVIRGLDTKLFYSLNKLERIIKAHKDILPKLSNKDVIYKLCCKNCDTSYVGRRDNAINSTTLSILTPGIRILYFYVFYRWKWLEEESKRSKFNVMIIVN